jgi:lipopolysaccharide biosynthesis protein
MGEITAIAFVLPQYHPIPENDEWWGKGFTEWTNVTRAKPLFPGHYQPHLPADLGFYDLRVPETRAAQAALAREYGIHGFCYYHYWFNGRRLLQRPVDDLLALGEPDFPFCLCWANENWTRAWDGGKRHILLGQNYCTEDDVAHMRWLCRVFDDPRYIRIDGKPLFLVYRASHLPDVARTVATWREVAAKEGIGDLYLCHVESGPKEHCNPATWGFDAAVEFAPDWTNLGPYLGRGRRSQLLRFLRGGRSPWFEHNVFGYEYLMERMLGKEEPGYLRFPCVTPMWDNSARRKTGAVIFQGSTPELYEGWLSQVVARVKARENMPQVCFINAWNEWAEGNHLEPCQRWDHSYLKATRRALQAGQCSGNVNGKLVRSAIAAAAGP